MKCICCERNVVKPTFSGSLRDGENQILNEEDYIWKTTHHGENRTMEKAENRMWDDGIVSNIAAGYGSKHDGSMYVISICDECIDKKQNDGIIAFVGDYLFANHVDFTDGLINESKKLWRRDQNLDKLI